MHTWIITWHNDMDNQCCKVFGRDAADAILNFKGRAYNIVSVIRLSDS